MNWTLWQCQKTLSVDHSPARRHACSTITEHLIHFYRAAGYKNVNGDLMRGTILWSKKYRTGNFIRWSKIYVVVHLIITCVMRSKLKYILWLPFWEAMQIEELALSPMCLRLYITWDVTMKNDLVLRSLNVLSACTDIPEANLSLFYSWILLISNWHIVVHISGI